MQIRITGQISLISILSGILIILCGCTTTPETMPPPEEVMTAELAFLQDGTISREDTLMRLGMPSATFEEGRILIYPLKLSEYGEWIIPPSRMHEPFPIRMWEANTYSLVLLFNDEGILQRHRLVQPDVHSTFYVPTNF